MDKTKDTCASNQDNITNEKSNDDGNPTTSEEDAVNQMEMDDIKIELNTSTICDKDNTDQEYEETLMVMHLDGKYDANLLRSCISNGIYKLRKKDDGSLIVQVGHSVFDASFNETCGSDLLFPVKSNPDDNQEEFGDPLTSDIRLVCKKTNNPFFKNPVI